MEAKVVNFFKDNLKNADPVVYNIIESELGRQQHCIELIASENIVSKAVLEAMGSILTNKYAEGYSGKRYYQGCKFIDEMETLCIERAKQIFGAKFVNVQPHSGAQANTAVFFALLNAGDTIMGMSLDAGGHLTHGAKPTISGKWFHSVQYGVKEDGYIDYEQVEKLALENKPKLIVAAYPRLVDFNKFREIADKVGAYLMVDMAHFAGLVAGGVIPSPIGIADVVTTTTHKTLRGPRGGMILTNSECVAFGEILRPEWKVYAEKILKNAKVLGETLMKNGFDLVSGGTDTHLILVDLRSKGITGKEADLALENAGITCNKNGIPNDPNPPSITSGIRLGVPAITTRGFKEKDVVEVANLITEVIDDFVKNKDFESETIKSVRQKVIKLCDKHPIY